MCTAKERKAPPRKKGIRLQGCNVCFSLACSTFLKNNGHAKHAITLSSRALYKPAGSYLAPSTSSPKHTGLHRRGNALLYLQAAWRSLDGVPSQDAVLDCVHLYGASGQRKGMGVDEVSVLESP